MAVCALHFEYYLQYVMKVIPYFHFLYRHARQHNLQKSRSHYHFEIKKEMKHRYKITEKNPLILF